MLQSQSVVRAGSSASLTADRGQVFESVLTEPALADLTAAIERVQQLNDEWMTRKSISSATAGAASLRNKTAAAASLQSLI